MKVIAGIFPPSSGQIRVNGSIGSMIDFRFGLSKDFTGNECIELRLIAEGIKKDKRKELIDKIKIETELGEYLNLPVKTYSSGMKFRLAFFTSLNIQSDILLLDEWIGTADQNLRDKVDKLILERIAQSKITLSASHNLDRLKKICNNIIYFEKGEISKIA